MDLGPPVGRPVQYRLSGPDTGKVRELARRCRRGFPQSAIGDVIFDWNEPGKVLRIDVAQDKARQYGISSEEVARRQQCGRRPAITRFVIPSTL